MGDLLILNFSVSFPEIMLYFISLIALCILFYDLGNTRAFRDDYDESYRAEKYYELKEENKKLKSAIEIKKGK